MPILIDGHNLLHAVRNASPDRPPSRAVLCHYLALWARRTRERVSIVFDGPVPSPGLLSQIEQTDLEIEFSGGMTADDVIFEKLATDSATRRMLVVSSDREVMRAARRRKARTMKSDAYWALVLRDLERPIAQNPEPRAKKTGLGSDESDFWMREFGFDGEEQPPPDPQ